MLQYSVYMRVCNGLDAVEKHRIRVKDSVPDNGAVRLMVITEKQYEAMDTLVGKLNQAELDIKNENFSVF